jgi:hypothetical protein
MVTAEIICLKGERTVGGGCGIGDGVVSFEDDEVRVPTFAATEREEGDRKVES